MIIYANVLGTIDTDSDIPFPLRMHLIPALVLPSAPVHVRHGSHDVVGSGIMRSVVMRRKGVLIIDDDITESTRKIGPRGIIALREVIWGHALRGKEVSEYCVGAVAVICVSDRLS